jgi:hypothetical protein
MLKMDRSRCSRDQLNHGSSRIRLQHAAIRAKSSKPGRFTVVSLHFFSLTRRYTCPLGIHSVPGKAAPPHRRKAPGAARLGALPRLQGDRRHRDRH